jgi:hypothetical protein
MKKCLKEMKNKMNKKRRTLGITAFAILFALGFLCGWRMMPHSKVISQTIYREPDTVIYAEIPDGWKCDMPKKTYDFLQPSGYWIGDTVDCWKLETPIDEYNIEMCGKTKDNYFCDEI